MRYFKHIAGSELASLILLSGSGLLLVTGAAMLPKPEYDPLGPAGLPRLIGIVLLILVGVRLLLARGAQGPTSAGNGGEGDHGPELKRTLGCAALTLVYLVTISIGVLPFQVVTVLYLLLFGSCMTHFSVKKLPLIALIALTVGVGLSYVFSDVLNIILPG